MTGTSENDNRESAVTSSCMFQLALTKNVEIGLPLLTVSYGFKCSNPRSKTQAYDVSHVNPTGALRSTV
jgi:hypothetical protein